MNKKLNVSNLLNIIKSVLLGTVITLVGVLILAIILKLVDIPTNAVGIINIGIKIIAIFLTCFSLSRRIENNILINSIFAGGIYAVVNFVIFSIINGKFTVASNNLIDFFTALVIAAISSIIITLFKKKSA